MSELFSGEWMIHFMDAWNAEPELAGTLGRIGFGATIGYGFDGEPDPRVVVVVERGRVTTVGPYQGEPLDWDLRATHDQWAAWVAKPPSLMALGLAYTQRKLRFKKGDYAGMVKDPRLAASFVRSFALLAD